MPLARRSVSPEPKPKEVHPESSPENVPIVAGRYVVLHDNGISVRGANGNPTVDGLSNNEARDLAAALYRAAPE